MQCHSYTKAQDDFQIALGFDKLLNSDWLETYSAVASSVLPRRRRLVNVLNSI